MLDENSSREGLDGRLKVNEEWRREEKRRKEKKEG